MAPTPHGPSLACAAALAGAFWLAAEPAFSQVLVATRPVRAGVVLTAADVAIENETAPAGALTAASQAVGREARTSLYPGRPILAQSLRSPTVVRRNQIVELVFNAGPLSIRTDGRALDDGGLGDRIRVMNLDSRQIVFGTVAGSRRVEMK